MLTDEVVPMLCAGSPAAADAAGLLAAAAAAAADCGGQAARNASVTQLASDAHTAGCRAARGLPPAVAPAVRGACRYFAVHL